MFTAPTGRRRHPRHLDESCRPAASSHASTRTASPTRRAALTGAVCLGLAATTGALGAPTAHAATLRPSTPRPGGGTTTTVGPATWTLHGQSPSALAHKPWNGELVQTVFPYAGRLYLGYGNYDANSGTASGLGCDVSYYDPATSQFVVDFPGMPTEAILTYRSLGGFLYATNTDPTYRSGDPGYGSFASNRSGSWALGGQALGGEHYYDVRDGVGGELFLAGGGGTAARLWRSTDGGATWTQLLADTDPVADGFERFYWIGRIGDVLYLKANLGSYTKDQPMRTYSLTRRTWGTVPTKSLDLRLTMSNGQPYLFGGEPATCGSAFISSSNIIYGNMAYAGLCTFTGSKVSQPLGRSLNVALIPSDIGAVYAATTAGIFRLSGTTATKVDPDGSMPGICAAVLKGRIYSGGQDACIWSRPMAAL